jgi:hypothetical protein
MSCIPDGRTLTVSGTQIIGPKETRNNYLLWIVRKIEIQLLFAKIVHHLDVSLKGNTKIERKEILTFNTYCFLF